MKYIMMEVKTGTITVSLPIMFPDLLVHADVAEVMTFVARKSYPGKQVQVVSAGFVPGLSVMSTTDKSESLKMVSRQSDADIINMADYGGLLK